MIFKSSGYFWSSCLGHGIVARNCIHFDHSLSIAVVNCFRWVTVKSDQSNSFPRAFPTSKTAGSMIFDFLCDVTLPATNTVGTEASGLP